MTFLHSRPVAVSERVIIQCHDCGERRSLTVRQARRAGRCPYCRFPTKVLVTDRYRRYWLERYTMSEIRDLASAIFDDLPQHHALVASVNAKKDSRILD